MEQISALCALEGKVAPFYCTKVLHSGLQCKRLEAWEGLNRWQLGDPSMHKLLLTLPLPSHLLVARQAFLLVAGKAFHEKAKCSKVSSIIF